MLRYVYIHSNEQEVAVAGAERGVVEDLVEDSELLAMGLEKGSMGARARPSLPAASMVTKAAGCSDEMLRSREHLQPRLSKPDRLVYDSVRALTVSLSTWASNDGTLCGELCSRLERGRWTTGRGAGTAVYESLIRHEPGRPAEVECASIALVVA